jgi:hypothetical protein
VAVAVGLGPTAIPVADGDGDELVDDEQAAATRRTTAENEPTRLA